MKIEDNLKQLILEKYKSIRAFSIENDIPYSTIDNIFKRGFGSIGISTATKICNILNIDMDAISEGKLQSKSKYNTASMDLSPDEVSHLELYRSLSDSGRKAADASLKILMELERSFEEATATSQCDNISNNVIQLRQSEQPASAGSGVYLGPEAFDLINVHRNSFTSRATYAVPVSGDSMEPKYHNGDILLVDAGEEVEIGDIGIFTLDGHGYVKKRGYVDLISLNPNYDPIPFDDSIRCNGRVIGILDPKWIVE